MITIKRAKPEDLPVIQRLGYGLLEYERQQWDHTLDTNWPFSEAGERSYRDAIDNRYTILAVLDGKAVGFLIGTIQIPPANSARNIITANLNNIYIENLDRGQGIGTELFRAFKDYCRENHVEKISVTVNAQNSQAIEFYKKHSFAASRIIMALDMDGDDKKE